MASRPVSCRIFFRVVLSPPTAFSFRNFVFWPLQGVLFFFLLWVSLVLIISRFSAFCLLPGLASVVVSFFFSCGQITSRQSGRGVQMLRSLCMVSRPELHSEKCRALMKRSIARPHPLTRCPSFSFSLTLCLTPLYMCFHFFC